MIRTDFIKITVAAINDVMDKYQKEKSNEWVKVPYTDHLKHAFIQMDNLTEYDAK